MINPILITKPELQDIQETLISLLNTFPELPSQIKSDGIFLEQLKPKNISMCLSTIRNPRKIRIDIDESYIAKYQFKIILQTMDTTNEERIESQAILSKISEWFEGREILSENGTKYSLDEYPKMSNHRKLLGIYSNSFPKLVQRLPPNIEITDCTFSAEYYVKNDF